MPPRPTSRSSTKSEYGSVAAESGAKRSDRRDRARVTIGLKALFHRIQDPADGPRRTLNRFSDLVNRVTTQP